MTVVDDKRPQRAPDVVGVCHVSGRSSPGSDPEHLVVRVVMTLDVNGGETAAYVVTGEEAACLELRRWMRRLCAPAGGA